MKNKNTRENLETRHQCVGANMIGKEEMALLREVVEGQSFFRFYGITPPRMVDTFEKEIQEYFGADYALATATGSGAYFCTAAALDFQPGDEVILPAFGWITDYSMIRLFGATPVFADVDESLNINPESVESRITEKTKAVIVIHYQGGASRLNELAAITKKHGILLIEDVAQALGGDFAGKKLGTYGDIACFSLQTRKMITSGDGGFLFTNNQEFFEKAVRYHDLGMIRPNLQKRLKTPVMTTSSLGMQFRMNELTGAAALAQFRKLPEILKKVNENFHFIRNKIIDGFPKLPFRKVSPENDIGILLAMDLLDPERVERFKKSFEGQSFIYGPTSWCETMDNIEVIREDLIRHGEYRADLFKKTEEYEKRFASIAVLPFFTKDNLEKISRGIIQALTDTGE